MPITPAETFDFGGKRGLIDDRLALIKKQLTEVTDIKYGQRRISALARNLNTSDGIMLRFFMSEYSPAIKYGVDTDMQD